MKCNNKDNIVNLYLYVNGSDSYLCRVYNGDAKYLESYRTYWFNTINTIDPKDCLSVDEMTYPTSGANGHVNHVNLWVEKGKTLIKDGWSDEAKVQHFAVNVAHLYLMSITLHIQSHKSTRPRGGTNISSSKSHSKKLIKYFVPVIIILCILSTVSIAKHTITKVDYSFTVPLEFKKGIGNAHESNQYEFLVNDECTVHFGAIKDDSKDAHTYLEKNIMVL